MQERNRAYRRWRAGVKKSAVKHYSVAGIYWIFPHVQTDRRILGIMAKSPKNCGCWMCSNLRQGHGLTHSEIKDRQQADVLLGLADYYSQ